MPVGQLKKNASPYFQNLTKWHQQKILDLVQQRLTTVLEFSHQVLNSTVSTSRPASTRAPVCTHTCLHTPAHKHLLTHLCTHRPVHTPMHTHLLTHTCSHLCTHRPAHTTIYTHLLSLTPVHTHLCKHAPAQEPLVPLKQPWDPVCEARWKDETWRRQEKGNPHFGI